MFFRLCQRGSLPPSLVARLSTRPSPPLKFNVKRVRVIFFFEISVLDFTKVTNVPLILKGFDGGLPANFLLELYDAEKMELKSQVTNKVPIFEVNIICQYLKSFSTKFAHKIKRVTNTVYHLISTAKRCS